MHLHQPPHQRQPDPQSSLRAVQGSLILDEQIEDMGQQWGGNAHPRVPHPQHHPGGSRVSREIGREPDAASRIGILGGILDQVDEDLPQPRWVSFQPHGAGRE